MTDPFQILQAVNSYYETAFSHLLTITLAVLGFTGVILPAVFGFFQYRLFKTERSSLESQITTQIDTVKEDLKAELEQKFESEKKQLQECFKAEIDSVNTKMNEEVSVAKAGTFLLQGGRNLSSKQFAQAACDYAFATQYFLLGKDEQNGQRALSALIDLCIPQLNITSFEQ